MPNYTFIVTLVDSGLPYATKEEAEKDAKEWANEIAAADGACMVAEVKVTEDE